MTIYEKAKSLVTAREAAEHYDATRSKGGADNHCSFDIHSFLIYTLKKLFVRETNSPVPVIL